MERQLVEFTIAIRILKGDAARQTAVDNGVKLPDGAFDETFSLVVNAMDGMQNLPIQLLPGSGSRPGAEPGDWFVDISAWVLDPAAIVEEAQERYNACWFDGKWVPKSLGEALYEVLAASNCSPSPDICGFEFVDIDYRTDASIPPAKPLFERYGESRT